jgi:hypothetical protein
MKMNNSESKIYRSEKVTSCQPSIAASTTINADSAQILETFTQITLNPKLYQMDTHSGVFVVKGELDQEGSIFETREKFLGIQLRLRFKVIEIQKPNYFLFELIRPFGFIEIQGGFFVKNEPSTKKASVSSLSLKIFQRPQSHGLKKFLAKLIFKSPIHKIIQNQIKKEVLMLKSLIENRTR